MDAQSPFSYACTRCSRCCVNKLIQVNPYELARLAGRLGLTTGEFRARFTDGARLNVDGDGRCVFLEAEGCSVHSDRPLVCRLFPLGRVVDEDGQVSFRRPDFEPGAAGVFGTDATVADYVEAQGAAPFIAAADAYFRWYLRARRADEGPRADPGGGSDLLDMDEQVAGWCLARDEEEPHGVEARFRLHLEILDHYLDEGGQNVPN